MPKDANGLLSVSVPDQAVGARIHAYARERKISGRALGRALGLRGPASISYKLRGVHGWSVPELIEAAKVLHVSVSDLLEGVEGVESGLTPVTPKDKPKPPASALFSTVVPSLSGVREPRNVPVRWE